MEDIAQTMYETLRNHESFDYGEWHELMPGQRAALGGAFDAAFKELRRRYASHPKLRQHWLDEVAKQPGLFR